MKVYTVTILSLSIIQFGIGGNIQNSCVQIQNIEKKLRRSWTKHIFLRVPTSTGLFSWPFDCYVTGSDMFFTIDLDL